MKHAQFRHYAICTLALVINLIIPGCSSTERHQHIATPQDVVARDAGMVLVEGLGSCGFCHGEKPVPGSPLSGGQTYADLYGEKIVPNITPAENALGTWTNEEFLRYFRTGLIEDDQQLSQIPHRGMEWMADEDIFAIIAYLRSLPAVTHEESHAETLSALDRNTSGFFEGRREVSGFVPALQKKLPIRYGQYLVEHVAACGRCHNSPNSLLSSSEFLKGGATIENVAGEKTVPNITNDPDEGIGHWSEDQIVSFLQTGSRPKGDKVDSRFCPVGFYRNAPVDDLVRIAKFLKTVAPE
jgi:mono/diheme cytochrome c family protein